MKHSLAVFLALIVFSTPFSASAFFSTSLGHVNSSEPGGSILGAAVVLAEAQIQAIIGLLSAFGADLAVVRNVEKNLRGIPTNSQDAYVPPKTTTTTTTNTTSPTKTTTTTTTTTSTNTSAGTRTFLMTLFDNPSSADTDIPMFREGDPQPAGKSVMHLLNWGSTSFGTILDDEVKKFGYDLSLVSAFLIDEPFWPGDGNVTNPCKNPTTDWRYPEVVKVSNYLTAAAQVVKGKNASARLWVNYSVPEVQWMQDGMCPFAMNASFIDVVSLDYYFVDFTTSVRPLYEWLLTHRAKTDQQLALIPGTGIRVGVDDPKRIAGLMPAFFEYAREKNKTCALVSGCPVWMVSGWPAINYQDGSTSWKGELDPSMTDIQKVWKAELVKTLSSITAKPPVTVIPTTAQPTTTTPPATTTVTPPPPPNNAPSTATISGSATGTVGQKLSFTMNATDPDGDQIRYGNNGGSGTSILYWSGYVSSGTSVALPDWVWSSTGTKTVMVQVQDSKGASSGVASYAVEISPPNNPPTAATIYGPTTGTVGQKLSFTLNATDPDGDQIRYSNNGGDNTQSATYWSDYVSSGTSVPLPDWIWYSTGIKTIWVQVQDSKGGTSGWASYSVHIQ